MNLSPRLAAAAVRSAAVATLLVLMAGGLAAQSIPHNTVEHQNWWIADREDLFPNYTTATGNRAGDAMFKVVPASVLDRGEDHLVSGYRLGISVDDAYTGSFPAVVEFPAVQLHRTRRQQIGAQTFEVPDLGRTVGPRFDPVRVSLPADGAWVVEVQADPLANDPKLRQAVPVPADGTGIAIVALAKAGDRRAASNPGIVMQASFNERHFAEPSYSGSIDAANGNAIRMYGTTGQPSASGELYAALRFANPTLQVFGSSAGGVASDPQGFETLLGCGAYDNDLPGRGGFFGLYVQAEQFDPLGNQPTHRAWPLIVATTPGGPTTTVDLGGVRLRIDPAALGVAGALIAAGQTGPIDRYKAASGVGFDEDQLGVWHSVRLPVPVDPSLRGLHLWLQALITGPAGAAGSTNAVRFSMR